MVPSSDVLPWPSPHRISESSSAKVNHFVALITVADVFLFVRVFDSHVSLHLEYTPHVNKDGVSLYTWSCSQCLAHRRYEISPYRMNKSPLVADHFWFPEKRRVSCQLYSGHWVVDVWLSLTNYYNPMVDNGTERPTRPQHVTQYLRLSLMHSEHRFSPWSSVRGDSHGLCP